MSKHRKRLTIDAPERRLADPSAKLDVENRLDGDHSQSSGKAKKQIDGIWVAVFMLGLLLLLLLLAWLEQ